MRYSEEEEVSPSSIDVIAEEIIRSDLPLAEFIKKCIYYAEITKRVFEQIMKEEEEEELEDRTDYTDEINELNDWIKKLNNEIVGWSKKTKRKDLEHRAITIKGQTRYYVGSVVTLQERIKNMIEEGVVGNKGIEIKKFNMKLTLSDFEKIVVQINTYYIREFLPFLRDCMTGAGIGKTITTELPPKVEKIRRVDAA